MENQAQAVPSSSVVRPWQGTFMAVLNIIGLVLLGIAMPMLLIGGSMVAAGGMMEGGGIFAALGSFLIVFIIAAFVLGIFTTIGFLKGKKVWVIVSLVMLVLGILGSIKTIGVVTIAVDGFFIYLHYACLKSPFYK